MGEPDEDKNMVAAEERHAGEELDVVVSSGLGPGATSGVGRGGNDWDDARMSGEFGGREHLKDDCGASTETDGAEEMDNDEVWGTTTWTIWIVELAIICRSWEGTARIISIDRDEDEGFDRHNFANSSFSIYKGFKGCARTSYETELGEAVFRHLQTVVSGRPTF